MSKVHLSDSQKLEETLKGPVSYSRHAKINKNDWQVSKKSNTGLQSFLLVFFL